MRRLALAAAATAAIVAIALAGAAATAAGGGSSSLAARTAANKRAAKAAAAHALTLMPVPAGATPVPGDPSGHSLVSGGCGHPATPNLVQEQQFWVVPGDPGTVLAQIEASKPAGSTEDRSGTGSGPNGDSACASFKLPALAGVISDTALDVSVAAAKGGGTAIGADGWAVWLTPRPRSLRVPSGVVAVQVGVTTFAGSPFRPTVLYRITGRARVARVVAAINALPVAQPGAVACPAIFGSERLLDVAFLNKRGRPLARVVENGCAGLSFYLHERHVRGLEEAVNLRRLLRR